MQPNTYQVIYVDTHNSLSLELFQQQMLPQSHLLEQFLKVSQVLLKPIQKQYQVHCQATGAFRNRDTDSPEEYLYTSRQVHHRTNYAVCFTDHPNRVVYMLPLNSILVLSKVIQPTGSLENKGGKDKESKSDIEYIIKKRDFNKHIESHLRNYSFQQQILNYENF